MWDKFKKSPKLPHLIRWYNHCCTLPALANVLDTYDARRKKNAEMKAKSSAKSGTGTSEWRGWGPRFAAMHGDEALCATEAGAGRGAAAGKD